MGDIDAAGGHFIDARGLQHMKDDPLSLLVKQEPNSDENCDNITVKVEPADPEPAVEHTTEEGEGHDEGYYPFHDPLTHDTEEGSGDNLHEEENDGMRDEEYELMNSMDTTTDHSEIQDSRERRKLFMLSSTMGLSSATEAPPTKRKRTSLSAQQKYEIYEFKAKNPQLNVRKIREIFGKKWGFELKERIVGDVLASPPNKWLKISSVNPDLKKLRRPKHEDMEKAVFKWCCTMKSKNVPLTPAMVRQKAREVGESMSVSKDFTYSNGWYFRFRSRYGLKNLKLTKKSTPNLNEGSSADRQTHGGGVEVSGLCELRNVKRAKNLTLRHDKSLLEKQNKEVASRRPQYQANGLNLVNNLTLSDGNLLETQSGQRHSAALNTDTLALKNQTSAEKCLLEGRNKEGDFVSRNGRKNLKPVKNLTLSDESLLRNQNEERVSSALRNTPGTDGLRTSCVDRQLATATERPVVAVSTDRVASQEADNAVMTLVKFFANSNSATAEDLRALTFLADRVKQVTDQLSN
ncbi:uncharacterized protein LOC141909985 [Tubulanus polymorphus]|uniref:uncharacterized protein LOC141909985 n=1 Tax=Tubulanus polymorphus TaxID=672921 RepID=UPI003DA4358C